MPFVDKYTIVPCRIEELSEDVELGISCDMNSCVIVV